MVYVRATILGGLPIIANVWYSYDSFTMEHDAGVDEVFWVKHDGSRGKEVSEAIYDKLHKYDEFWQSSVIEQANDWLGCNCPTRYSDGREKGEYTDDYYLLNPRP